MHMDDIGLRFPQCALQCMKTKRIPHGAHSTLQPSVEILLKYFIAVPVKFYDRVAAVLKKTGLGTIGTILPAWCRRSIKIVDEKNFHNLQECSKVITSMVYGP